MMNPKKSLRSLMSRGAACAALATAAAISSVPAAAQTLQPGQSAAFAEIKRRLDAEGQVIVGYSGRVNGTGGKNAFLYTSSRDLKKGYIIYADHPKNPTRAEVYLALTDIKFGNPFFERMDGPPEGKVSEGFRTAVRTKQDADRECQERKQLGMFPEGMKCNYLNDVINGLAHNQELPFMRGNTVVQFPSGAPEAARVTVLSANGTILGPVVRPASIVVTVKNAATIYDSRNVPQELYVTNEGLTFIPKRNVQTANSQQQPGRNLN